MLVGAAVCPHPPLLVPDVSSGAAPELDALRAACDDAVRRLVQADPTGIVVVGRAPTAGPLSGTGGSFSGYGVPLAVGAGDLSLPLAHTIGCWLLDRAGWTGDRRYVGATDTEIPDIADEDRIALLVMGDGSARRTEKAPGYFDSRAEAFDTSVATALQKGPDDVAKLDGRLAAELLAAGWSAWQTLARAASGQSWSCELLYDEAAYGVGYFVASWLPA